MFFNINFLNSMKQDDGINSESDEEETLSIKFDSRYPSPGFLSMPPERVTNFRLVSKEPSQDLSLYLKILEFLKHFDV